MKLITNKMNNFDNLVTDVPYLRQKSYYVGEKEYQEALKAKGIDPLNNPEAVVDVLSYLTQEDKDKIQNIIKELRETIVEKGYGLSACQLESVRKNGAAPRVSYVYIPGKHPLELNMVNPEIKKLDYPFSHKGEGCLSFPGKFYTTTRYQKCVVQFADASTWQPRELTLYGLEAVVVQHEVDHLDGILYMDHERKPVVVGRKTGANEPCPCGSGKKYKKCCKDVGGPPSGKN
jgi:peptide deformylase